YENTYKIDPDVSFPVAKVEEIIRGVLSETLSSVEYNVTKAKEKCKSISNSIKERVKALELPRYKLVVLAHVGGNQGQEIKVTSRCVWSHEFDNYATASYCNSSVFAQATVYGIFFE
ncbi:predicted protein, partial [Nematostella vectensis]